MNELVFFLEEESAKAMLEGIVPKLVPPQSRIKARYIVFEGKQDLEKQLSRKLRGYLNPNARFIVLRDQDQSDCRKTKNSLALLCQSAGRPETRVRISCHELETFYLGDLRAVEAGLEITGISARQRQARFRDPDRLSSPARELEKLTGKRYQKVAGSRAIAPHLNLREPRSKSFHHLIEAIRKTVDALHSLPESSSSRGRSS